jgi:hypothetical protein
MNNLKCFRLNSGIIMMAELTSTSDTHYEIVNAVNLNFFSGPNGETQCGISAAAPLGTDLENEISLRKDLVMFHYNPNQDLKAMYSQIFSNLVVARPNIVSAKQLLTN